MTDEAGVHRERRIKSLFEQASSLAPEDRSAFFELQCRDDPGLLDRVELLLDRAETTGDFLEPSTLFSWNGRQVGRYRIIREIGWGGSSTVFLAERTTQDFQQVVAIKVLRRGWQDEEARNRFHRERQILATLDHPSIVRLIDGGEVDDEVWSQSVPYVVLDWVDGIPITTFCEQEQLETRARIELFCEVCDAVSFAHRRLVIHRDLKPSNVLVSRDGRPRLLDFGIAKLLSSEAELVEQTRTQLMTLHYASPEQLRGVSLTVATDVYSLGVLLCELLTGTKPTLDRTPTPSNPEQLFEERRPSKNAIRLAGLADHLPSAWRDDISRILAKTLAENADQRYLSVEALRADLGRLLRGEPITARPPSLLYRVRKYVARNRLLSSLIVIATCFLIGLAIQTGRFIQERDLATAHLEEARDVTDFLVQTLAVVEPFEPQRESVPVTELLTNAARRGREQLSHRPWVLGSLLNTIGQSYYQLGMHDQALPLFEEVARLEPVADERDEARAASLLTLALIHGAAGRSQAAVSAALEGLASRERRYSEDDPRTARARDTVAAVHLEAADFDAAAAANSSSRAVLEPQGPSRALADSLALSARIGEARGAYDQAEQPAREALQMYREVLGPNHPSTANALDVLANILMRFGKNDEAEPLHREALELRRRQLRPDHPAIIEVLNNLGVTQMGQGNFEQAQATLEEALHLRRRALGPRDALVATSLHNLASVHRQAGHPFLAIELLEQALEILEEHKAPDDPEIANTLNTIALVHQETGDIRSAEPMFRRSLALAESSQAEAVRMAPTLINLGALLGQLGRFAEAETQLVRAAEILSELGNGQHPYVAAAENALAVQLLVLGRVDEAQRRFRAGLELVTELFGDDHPWPLISRINMAEVDLHQDSFERCDRELQALRSDAERLLGATHAQTSRLLQLLGLCKLERGQLIPARELLESALEAHRAGQRQGHVEAAITWLDLADAQLRLGDIEAVLVSVEAGRQILDARLPDDHWLHQVATSLVSAAAKPNSERALLAARELQRLLGSDARATRLAVRRLES